MAFEKWFRAFNSEMQWPAWSLYLLMVAFFAVVVGGAVLLLYRILSVL